MSKREVIGVAMMLTLILGLPLAMALWVDFWATLEMLMWVLAVLAYFSAACWLIFSGEYERKGKSDDA